MVEFKDSIEQIPSKMLSNRLKKLQSIGFISKQKGTINKKSIYYLLEQKLVRKMLTEPQKNSSSSRVAPMYSTKVTFHLKCLSYCGCLPKTK